MAATAAAAAARAESAAASLASSEQEACVEGVVWTWAVVVASGSVTRDATESDDADAEEHGRAAAVLLAAASLQMATGLIAQ